MQPYLFPYIGYFQLIKSVDYFVIFDNVNFIKKGWINRNRILFNKNEKMFSIPLVQPSQNKLINEIELFEWEKNKSQFLNLIISAYQEAPQFDKIIQLIEESLTFSGKYIVDMNIHSLKVFCEFLQISTHFKISSEIVKFENEKGEEKVLTLLEQLNAETYINAPNGKSLYTKDKFDKSGIELLFLKIPKVTVYKQRSDSFIPFLSIIDVLMNIEKEKIIEMVNDFEIEVSSGGL